MKNNNFKLLIFLLVSNMMTANISLPNIFSDNMVLQRNTEAAIWGWASPNEEIIIKPSWDSKEYKTKADNQANWKLSIPTPNAGGPFTISIKGYNEIILNNILIGEVWICSGQSNMEMSPDWGIDNGDEEIKNANQPTIRFFTVPKLTALSPQNDLLGNWVACSSQTMKDFSAVGYFFARRLQEDLKNVPIGLIASNWGGTPAEIWTPTDVIQNDPILLESARQLNRNEWGPSQPGRAFNAMIHPLVGFEIAGVIWYQGESNVGAKTYTKTFAAMITSWRSIWRKEFPFYFVQIAPFNYGPNHFGGAEIRDAQRKTLQAVSNTGMATISDISTIDDIHPKNKKNVGIRLANLALVNTYKTNRNLVNGPLFKDMKIDENKAILEFDYADGLYFKDKKNTQFEVAGQDGTFFPAQAMIKGTTVIIQSDKVKKPVNVRFAWKNTDQSALFNKANLPASTFTTE